jgi:hypothetical protein
MEQVDDLSENFQGRILDRKSRIHKSLHRLDGKLAAVFVGLDSFTQGG